MTDFPNRNLKQDALYWGSPSASGWGGSDWDDPVEIKCRWELRQEVFRNAQGDEVHSQAIVYLSQDLDIGGYLRLGDLDDISSDTETPDEVDGAFEIRGFAKIPNVKGTKFVRKAWL
jgi:hypothetical protein